MVLAGIADLDPDQARKAEAWLAVVIPIASSAA
jgi:hypothetical protein